MKNRNDPHATGSMCSALGCDVKITPKYKCNRSFQRDVYAEFIKDGLPIPTFAFVPCIFNFNGGCAFSGECVDKSTTGDNHETRKETHS